MVFSRTSLDAAKEFRKGIKRDKTHYAKLKDEKQWDKWKRKTEATVKAHGCDNILDVSYNPTPPEQALFDEMQRFMYDVFNNIILTPMGKYFVFDMSLPVMLKLFGRSIVST